MGLIAHDFWRVEWLRLVSANSDTNQSVSTLSTTDKVTR